MDSPDKAALLALAERCERASGPDRELDLDVWWWAKANGGSAKQPMPEDYRRSNLRMNDAPRYTASLDAAMALVPAPDWEWSLEKETGSDGEMFFIAKLGDPMLHMEAEAATPALAFCAASLRARARAEQPDSEPPP